MDEGSLYDLSAFVVLLLLLAGFLARNKRRATYLIVGAVCLGVGELIAWLAHIH